MLYLVFQIGADRYAIEGRTMIEVVPFIRLRKIQNGPDYIAGVMNYREKIIPVVDLCQLLLKRPVQKFLSSRILLLDFDPVGGGQPLGILVEHATETYIWQEFELKDPPLNLEKTPYLGKIIALADGLIQVVNPSALLNQEVRDLLFLNNTEVEHGKSDYPVTQ